VLSTNGDDSGYIESGRVDSAVMLIISIPCEILKKLQQGMAVALLHRGMLQ